VYWEVTSNTNLCSGRFPHRALECSISRAATQQSTQRDMFRTAQKCRYINDSQSTRVPEIVCPRYEQYSLIFGIAASARMTPAHPIAC
jgi:hypothetical protein